MNHSIKIYEKHLCKVRTITAFICLSNDKSDWETILNTAKLNCQKVANNLIDNGYIVQSLRLVTNPFGEYINTDNIDSAKQDLAYLTNILNKLNKDNPLRLRFAIGEAKTAKEIELLPELIRDYGDLCNACVNIDVDEYGFLDNDKIINSVHVINRIANITPNGQGNFNFTVNFNCNSFIPYFPASYHRNELGNVLVVGLETPDLLVTALNDIRHQKSQLSHAKFMQLGYEVMHQALSQHILPINNIVNNTTLTDNYRFIGIDTSAAPSKNCSSMTQLYELLGVPFFGASGTVEVSALLTKVFKSIAVTQVGFSGLMLAVTEDVGLAIGTQRGDFDIHGLLTFSSVCGIGLDTVPIEGDTSPDKIVRIMRDTGTMAYRLNKPLTVRLFPVPNLVKGQITTFESDDLCNCAVMELP
ncbi:DUF711 family protein [Moraxella oblonga]|uniref:DUF711 family protein n=1 Tax=Moraxella oblonga TaxID=200413 RepID=UPI00082B843D|nr:DUF711 family protein [Moraxella oblonga]